MLADLGILIVRIFVGLPMAAHGAQKLFGWFGGYGLKGTGGFFESLGFKPGVRFAAAAALSEFMGGILLALGLFTPVAAMFIISTMLVAMVTVHWKNGFFAMSNGIEVPFLYAVIALGLAFTGAGIYSLDSSLALTALFSPLAVTGLIILSVVGASATLLLRQHEKSETVTA